MNTRSRHNGNRRLLRPALVASSMAIAAVTAFAGPSQGSEPRGPTTVPVLEPLTAASQVRAVFYYPWFPEVWHSTDHYVPSAGQYSNDDPATLGRQFADMHFAGLDAAISSWWGQGTKTDARLPYILDAAAAHSMTVTPYYEPDGTSTPPSLSQLQSDLAYLRPLTARPGWLKVDGKPVMFVYNAPPSNTCSDVTKWKEATNGFADWYVSMKVFLGYASCADQPDSWHQYGPAVATADFRPYSYNVSPGFWKYNESTPRLPRDLARFESDLASMVGSGAQWQLVTSYSEWGEGTAVESSPSWASASGHGTFIDAMRAAFATPPDVDVAPSADSYTRQNVPNKNYGTSSSLYVEASPIRRSYLKFTNPNQTTATSAALSLTMKSSQATGFRVFTATSSSWIETGITYVNAPAANTAVCATSGPVATGQRVTVNLDLRKCPIEAGATVTLVLDSTSVTNLNMASRECTAKPNLHLSFSASRFAASDGASRRRLGHVGGCR